MRATTRLFIALSLIASAGAAALVSAATPTPEPVAHRASSVPLYSAYALQLYPEAKWVRVDGKPTASVTAQSVDRSHKGDRLPVRQALTPTYADALKVLRDEYERRSGGYMLPFHCSIAAVSGCQAI